MANEPKKKDEEVTPPPADDTDPPLTQSQLNAALADSKKRTEKMIADAVNKAVEAATAAFKAAQPAPKNDETNENANTVKAAEARAQKRIEELERKFLESENARTEEANARRRDAAQAQLRVHLEGVNVRKEALDVLVAAATVNGMLRYDDDGRPLIAVKRARTKSGPAEEQTFEDFKQGIEDWAKSPEAAAFIKAPSTTVQQKPGSQNATGAPPRYAKQIASEDEGIDRVLEIINSDPG